jgi:hypothetical protein
MPLEQKHIDKFIALQKQINRQASDKVLRAKGQAAKARMLQKSQAAGAKPATSPARGGQDWIVVLIPPGSGAPKVLTIPQSQFEKVFGGKVTPSK